MRSWSFPSGAQRPIDLRKVRLHFVQKRSALTGSFVVDLNAGEILSQGIQNIRRDERLKGCSIP